MAFGKLGAMGRGMGHLGYLGGVSTFDIFVDSVNGSDANSGTTPALAKATLNGVTQRSGLRVGLARGSIFRESWTITSAGVSVGVYGSGNAPRLSNSVLHTSGWTLVSGTEYKKVIGYTALNAFQVSGSTVTKLILGTAGSLTSGQFGVTGTGGTTEVRVNIGSDPNAANIEIPASGTANLIVKASNTRLRDFASWFSPDNGVTIIPASTAIDSIIGDRLDIRYNAADGWNVHATNTAGTIPATNVDIQNSIIKRNGQTRTLSGSAGDGVSVHDTCTGRALFCDIQDNEKSGITNQFRVSFETFGCYFRNNNQEWLVLDDELGLGGGGTHKLQYSIIVVPGSSDGATYGVGTSSISKPTTTLAVRVENNVIYGESIVANRAGLRLIFGAMTAKNNIISGFARGIDWRSTDAGSLDNDYNDMFGNSSNYFTNGTPGVVAGAHDITSDPKFVNPATFDFSLQGTSPCINAGTNVGLTSDKSGVAVPLATNPCIGAYERLAA
jgi:hypothetical protein